MKKFNILEKLFLSETHQYSNHPNKEKKILLKEKYKRDAYSDNITTRTNSKTEFDFSYNESPISYRSENNEKNEINENKTKKDNNLLEKIVCFLTIKEINELRKTCKTFSYNLNHRVMKKYLRSIYLEDDKTRIFYWYNFLKINEYILLF